ncbi:MAG: hypothetical protein GKS03_07765, partial [Alphaproteobacteria bacterium]|nr:hypothetical protein [Alphaproteobacteria bacterium]
MSLFQDPDLVLSATFLSRVAYDDNLGGLTLENALDVEGWDLLDQNELTAYGATGIQNGYFVSQGPGSNGDAVAFAAKSGSTLVLAFRGSDTPGDLFDASFDQEDQIGRLQPFIEAVSGYALDPVNGITKVLITGHSLGGQLTELVLRDEIEADSADRLFVGQGNLQVDFITFSSPGFGDGGATPEYTSIAQDITFLAIGNTGDPVWNKDYPGIIGNFQFGPVVEIDLPEVPGGLLNVAEHSIVFLESQISALVNSQLHDLVSSADQADQDTDPDIQIVLGGQEGVDDIDPTSDDTIDLSMDPGGQSYFIHGLGGQDILSGGPESDAIDGGDENDTIDGGPGGDKIDGGAGIDTVDYSKENGASGVIVILNSDGTGLVSDTHGDVDSLNSIENVIGTDRFDYIVHSDQDGVIDGGTGSDQIFGAGGDDVIYGGDNTDRIEGGAGNNTLYGEGGADLILGGNESDTIFGGENDDQLQGAGSDQASSDMGDQIYGNNGSDLIYGYAGDDTLDGGADNDLLGGAEGQDTLFGGSGSDHLYGGSDSDVLTGGTGGDYFHLATDQWGGGGHASPWLFGSLASGSDTVTDFGAEDFIVFQGQAFAGNIFLDYPSRVAQALGLSAGAVVEESPGTKYVVITLPNGQGSTKFYGDFNLEETGGGWDPDLEFTVPVPDTNYDLQISQGDEGNNFLFGSSDDDQIDGAGGNDFLDGQDGNDNIFGGSGDDELIGGAGDDVLVAGTGFDTLDGGTGNDTYEFAIGDGENIVRDQVGENNTIILTDTLALSDITISASTRVLPDENGDDQTYDVAEVRFEASQQDILVLVGMTQNADGSFSGPFDKIKLSDESELSLSVAPGDVIYGTSGNDNITIVYPTYTDASLFGFSGDDTLIGNAYSNYINGGSGDDYIDGINSSNGNVLEGGSGNDTLIGGGGADILDGGSGNDFLEGRVGADTLDGGLGDDILWVRYEDQVLYGGGGSDEFVMWAGSAVIMDANSNDILKIGGSNIGGVATDRVGNDLQIRVVGLSVPTVIVKDHFIASDKLQAINFIGTGDPDLNQAFDLSLLAVDPVTGGPLSDVLQGTDFDDTIHGGASPDILHGEDGNDLLYGGHGNDFILGGEGDDVIYGGSNHSVSINDTDDFQELLDGGAGSDTIHAGESGYSFYGIAKGGDGNDQIHSTGLSFYASVDGGDGDDVITVATHNTQGDFIGGAGNDVFHINLHSGGKFVGGPGDDTYHINPPPAASNGNWFLNTRIEDTEGSGRIILTDHHYWSPDRVVFERSGDDLRITRTNDDGVVLSSSGITVVDHFSDTASGKISILEFVSGSVFALDNFAPDANSDAVGTGVDQSLVITPELLIANDSDLDGDDVTVLSVTSLGGGNIVVNPDGTFQFTPLPGFDGLATFEYSVEDENGAQSTGKGTVVVGLSGELVYGSDSVDVLDGSSSDEYFLAGDGADIVNADSGDDTLNGQLGADTLYGESGDDVYLFELGDGQDTITENTGQDRIELGPGISQSDLIFSKTSTHLIISIAGTSDSIQITKQYHADSKFHLESLKLDDGTEIDLTGPLPLTGSNGNVTLYGSAGNDTLISADGVTIYRGEKGNDTYDYSFGGANDSIVENTGDDTLSFGSGV